MSDTRSEPSPPQPASYYCHNNDYNYGFQRLSTLMQMGYPVERTEIHPDEETPKLERLKQVAIERGADDRQPLIKFCVNSTFNTKFIGYTGMPGVEPALATTNLELERNLKGHPIKLLFLVNSGQSQWLMTLYKERAINPEHMRFLAHENPSYPYTDVIGRCALAAQEQLEKRPDLQIFHYQPEYYANDIRGLLDSGLRPINGEQVAGLFSDYYHLIERNFPEFVVFKNSWQRNPIQPLPLE